MGILDITYSIYGKVFDDFINEVKTQKKDKPFNEIENDFFEDFWNKQLGFVSNKEIFNCICFTSL